jgi:hypothetical protein
MGGGKGGSDFNPKGKSDLEVNMSSLAVALVCSEVQSLSAQKFGKVSLETIYGHSVIVPKCVLFISRAARRTGHEVHPGVHDGAVKAHRC